MRKEKRENKRKLLLLRILTLIFVLLLIYSIVNIAQWIKNNNENKEILNSISKTVEVVENGEDEEKYKIDFEELKKKNPDTVAWLKVENTNIEFPVVQAKNNSYYLTHNFNKEYNTAGWIFADYKNKLDTTDKNIVIYGHNMRDNSMFGSLKDVIKEEWYNNEENKYITFITENAYQVYQVFSVYQIEKEDYYIQTKFKDDEFSKFVDTIKQRSKKDFAVEVSNEDTILTLSTCANNNKYRVVLHSVRVK